MSLLIAHRLSYAYTLPEQTVPVLHEVNFSINAGQMVAICGSSGSGKSTLLYLLGGLLHVQKGQLILDGYDLSKMSSDQLALFRNQKIGYVFQQFHLLPKLNVLENILLPTHYRPSAIRISPSEDREKAIKWATFLGLGDRLHHHPSQLSGGQQQRVAIARALMNDPEMILADEPTGNLDSKSSAQIIELLKELNRKGKTVLIITHDESIASQCDSVYRIKDGYLNPLPPDPQDQNEKILEALPSKKLFKHPDRQLSELCDFKHIRQAFTNLFYHKTRSFLTMLGIVIGISALMAMITLGGFTKEKILDSYSELGINTLMFQGYPSWGSDAAYQNVTPFEGFSWNFDVLPLKRIFKEIKYISPRQVMWPNTIYFGGEKQNEANVLGSNHLTLQITNKKLSMGRFFSTYHIEQQSPVCVIGYGVAKTLFKQISPLGKLLVIKGPSSSYNCSVIGVLEKLESNKEWITNKDILIPHTYYSRVMNSRWHSQINKLLIEVSPGTDMDKLGKSIKGFFTLKYGHSGDFSPNSETLIVGHMQKFLTLFTILLTIIAAISLFVGGIGVTNMMLISVSERFREIGLKKALGATDRSIRTQFLFESGLLCLMAGLLGLGVGFLFYEGAIWGATQLTDKVEFVWVFNTGAFFISFVSIFTVGFFSGLFPAYRAKKLQIIEALRSE